jgi:hypothetical protein
VKGLRSIPTRVWRSNGTPVSKYPTMKRRRSNGDNIIKPKVERITSIARIMDLILKLKAFPASLPSG